MDGDTSSTSSNSCESEEVQKIVLHVYDDESKEFTSLTTYHGMIRIYTSTTWPSRIFWTLVVVICLSLFMIQGGILLKFYYTHPSTYKITTFQFSSRYLPAITICPIGFKEHDHLFEIIVNGYTNNYLDSNSSYFNNSTLDLMEKFSYKCDEVIESIEIANRKRINFCKNAKRVLSDAGVCYTFDYWKTINSDKLKIRFQQNFARGYLFQMHDVLVKPSNVNSKIWIKQHSTTILSFSVEEKILLSKRFWGTCREEDEQKNVYNFNKCSDDCRKKLVKKSCLCNAFYEKAQNHCTLQQILNYLKFKCKCQPHCYQVNYKYSPIVSLQNYNISAASVLNLKLNSNKVVSKEQYLRFKQIDLMSYMGGLMGLFLGMSCVTLLEVFVYLFKSVFGTLNNNRHKKFVEGLLGDTADDLNRSHEEIIITKKVESYHKNLSKNNLQVDTIKNETRHTEQLRRMSTYAQNNENGLKIQLYRPNYALRRNSTYFDACDF